MEKILRIGLDVGSTTVKLVVINNENSILYSKYQRHYSDIRSTIIELIEAAYEKFSNENRFLNFRHLLYWQFRHLTLQAIGTFF